MFCYQCQETAGGKACTVNGVCGKKGEVANLQDLLIYVLKGISHVNIKAKEAGVINNDVDRFITENLFSTITNANFDKNSFIERIKTCLSIRSETIGMLEMKGVKLEKLHESATWHSSSVEEFEKKALEVGVLSTENEDIRSLRQLITLGLKGIAAYMEHSENLGYDDENIHGFLQKALVATTDDSLSADDLVALVLECGEYGVDALALLDKANTETYGNPEITSVNIGVRNNPGILISGH
ncbi:MAG: hydroxylamine reductase, partial [bacterium]|nr:hydroxylamine reductase [bacterium]